VTGRSGGATGALRKSAGTAVAEAEESEAEEPDLETGGDAGRGDEGSTDGGSSGTSLRLGSKCTVVPESRGRVCPPCGPGFLRMPVGCAS
jgi:hypothetical protein